MAQPVKLSDDLIEAARSTAEDASRSLAGQIEHWASIGRAVEGLLTSSDIHTLKRANSVREKETPYVGQINDIVNALAEAVGAGGSRALSERIARVDSVRYGTDPAFPGLMVRVDANGTKTPGRFVGRTFMPLAEVNRPKRAASRK